MTRSPAPMLLRYLVWLAVPVLALIELGAYGYHATRAPEPEEWRQLLPKVVAEMRQKQELVVAAPYWSEPNLRYALGDAVMPLRDIARPHEQGYERALEVSLNGERAAELEGWQTLNERRVGPFQLRVLQNPQHRKVLFDFVDNLKPENVSVGSKKRDGFDDCPWNPKAKVSNGALDFGHPTFPAERFECKGADWNFVGVTVIEDERYRPRRCIWAQPSKAKRVTFRDVLLGRTIRGHAGLPYWIERWKKKEPITIEVSVGEEALGEAVHMDGEGWKEFQMSSERFAGQRAEVTFEISARTTSQRQLCFHAEVL